MMKFLIKGLLRDRSRSLFPIIMVSAGVFLTVLLYSFMKGVIGGMVETSAKFDAGHVKIMTRAYDKLSDQVPNDLALLGIKALMDDLRKTYPHMTWTARIKFGGLLDIPDAAGETRAQGPVFGMGIDLLNPKSPETAILGLAKSVVKGCLPAHPNEILISDAFARKLGLEIGQTATLISATMNGAMATHNFKVVGTIVFGMVALDKHTIVANINDIRQALNMPDGAGEVLGFTKDMIYKDTPMKQLAKAFNARHSLAEDEFSPIMVALAERGLLSEMLGFANAGGAIMVGIFVFAMAIVLWNAGLMNGIRRYGEVGIRLALGEPKGRIYRAMIFESVVIGIIGSVVGTIFGLALSYWMQYYGLDYSSMMQKATVLTSNVIRAQVTAVSYFIGFFPGVLASMLGTIFAGIGIYKRQTSQLFRELEV